MKISMGIIGLIILLALGMGSCKSGKYHDGVYRGTGNG